jgi:murein DD-endopeptidase MepM/ murein hydrolase activator NlpD
MKIWYTTIYMKYIAACLLICCSCLVLFAPVFASTDEINALNAKIAEKKEKVKQIEQSIEGYKKQIDIKRTEAVSLATQIAILDNRRTQVELDIDATQIRLDTLELELQSLGLQITDKEDSIARQKKILAELLRTIHQSEQKNSLEVFVAYDNFSDFYNQAQAILTVERDIGRTAKGVRLAKEDLEAKKIQTEEIRVSVEKTKEALSAKRQELEEQADLKSGLLAKTKSSELTFQTLVNSLRSQYQQIEGEISGIEAEVRKKLEAQQKLGDELEDAGSDMLWPVPSKYITAYFHDPSYPYRHVFEHNAIDIRAGQGTPVKAAASGYVARAKYCNIPSCYSFIMIVHSGGISTVYGHMSALYVKEDVFVARGDVIGLSGGTPGTNGAGPFVTGPHLHFEVRDDGVPVNPLNYLSN